MEKAVKESAAYRSIRTVIVSYGVPAYEMSWGASSTGDASDALPQVSLRGFSTFPTTVNVVCKSTRTRLAAVKRRVKARDFAALLELLDEAPWYAYHPWVRDALRRFRDHPRLKRPRKRPRGRTKLDPLAVMGVVNALREGRRVRSREQAFWKIEEWGLCSAETAKRLHMKALKEVTTKPRSVAIEFPDDAVLESEAEVQAIRARAETLQPYSTIERTIADPERGQVALRVEGLEAGAPTRDFFLLTRLSVFVETPDNTIVVIDAGEAKARD